MSHGHDMNWSVDFEITLNGAAISFDMLDEQDQQYILDEIKDGYFSGTFNDINWSVIFDITIDCMDNDFNNLDALAQEYILNEIECGFFSGTTSGVNLDGEDWSESEEN